ncbi:MAG: SRPBCC domain-containing protein [Tessaracoccus sp.]
MSSNFEIRKEITLEATPEQVWQAIATPEGQAAWSPDPYAMEQEGMLLEQEPLHRLAVRTPAEANGAFHAFEYLIESQDGAITTLRFVHSGFLGDDWNDEFNFEEMTSYGWDMYLHTLEQYLTYFAGRPSALVTTQAPMSSAAPGSWSVLEKALGLDGPVHLGETVRLAPDGLPAIEGVVDYVIPTDDFIAIRAADGLYRFHNLAPMNMPIAIGHYIYDDINRDRVQAEWHAWLERVFA